MIARFHQSKSRPVCEYVITDATGSSSLGTAENADVETASLEQNPILYLSDAEYQIHITLKKSIGSDGTKQHRYPIFVNGVESGAIELRDTLKKVRFLKYEGYKYEVFPVGGEMFELCEVGFGKDQHYFCLHRRGVTAAIVHMEDEEVNYCNDYTIYAEDENAFIAACLSILYKEAIRYNNQDLSRSTAPMNGAVIPADYASNPNRVDIRRSRMYNSVDASLRARFDPDFIPRIQARDGRN